VLPGIPHHITHKAGGSLPLFPTDYDKHFYLGTLKDQCECYEASIIGYCLMPNHIHLVLIPSEEECLAQVMRRTQGRYSSYYNASRNHQGHIWHDRFYSCPLGEAHLIHALRYVDRNPVRAGLVDSALSYPWSSARAHVGIEDTLKLVDMKSWQSLIGDLDWRVYICEEDQSHALDLIREHTRSGRPLGLTEK
jgi:putative transposase